MRRIVLLLASIALTVVMASGVALAVNKVGTDGRDFLSGTNRDDNLVGRGGNDVLSALAGEDNLLGGEGKDVVTAETLRGRSYGGEKNMDGGRGNDFVFGGKSSDNLVGGGGNDYLIDGYEVNPKKDVVSAGDGNDGLWVWNRPAGKDVVTCGGGFDRVFADRDDMLAPDCERVFIGRGSVNAFFDSFPTSFWAGLP